MADAADITFGSNIDPVFVALAAEEDAARTFLAALEALGRTCAEAAWLDYQTRDLKEAEAAAGAALTEAERRVLTTRPASIQGAAALLAFIRRYLADDVEIPASIGRVITALGHAEACLLGSLAAGEQRSACSRG